MRRQARNCSGGFGWWCHRTAAVLPLGDFPTELLRRLWGGARQAACCSEAAAARQEDSAQFILSYPLGTESAHTAAALLLSGNVRPQLLLEVGAGGEAAGDVQFRSQVRTLRSAVSCLFLSPKKNCCGDQRCSTAALLLLLLLLLRPKIFL